MAEQVKALAVKPENLSPIPGTDMAGEIRLLHVVLCLPPHAYMCTQMIHWVPFLAPGQLETVVWSCNVSTLGMMVWKNASTVKNACCSYRGLEFSSQSLIRQLKTDGLFLAFSPSRGR